MKHAILISLLGLFCTNLNAQNDIDAIRYSNRKFGSTAKSMAIGGAVGSLGADVSCASVNPAGLAQYQTSEFSFSLGFNLNNNNSTFLNNTSKDNVFKVNIPNVGLVFVNNTNVKKGETGWRNTTFSFNIARVADFNRVISFQGVNTQTSMMDYFAESADGRALNSLYGTVDDFANGFADKSSMAYEAYLFDSVSDFKYAANSSPVFHDIKQAVKIEQSGGMNEFNFSFASNYNDVIYLGATLNYTSVNFTEHKTHSEANDDRITSPYSMNNFTYSENLTTKGGGVTGRFGIVVRPCDYFRFGASIATPMMLNLHDEYNYSINSKLKNNAKFDLRSKQGIYDYSLVTPFRYTFSATSILGKYGFISADIENANFSSMHYSDKNSSNALDPANSDIKQKYTNAINYHVGAELVRDIWRLRGGFASYASPLLNAQNENMKSNFITWGLGLKKTCCSFDFAFVHNYGNDVYVPYSLKDTSKPEIYSENKFKANSIILSFTTKF